MITECSKLTLLPLNFHYCLALNCPKQSTMFRATLKISSMLTAIVKFCEFALQRDCDSIGLSHVCLQTGSYQKNVFANDRLPHRKQ